MAIADPSLYAEGSPLITDKDWYHGELSRDEAEQALATSGRDCFLVRASQGALILSLIHHGILHHIKIKHGCSGYHELESSSSQYLFIELEDLVSYYGRHDIKELKTTLGAACVKKTAGRYSEISK